MIAETVPLMPPHEAIPVIEEILRGAKVREDDELLDELIRLVDGICPPKEHLWPAAMPAPPKRLSGKAVWRMVSGVLFYGVLLLAILAAFLFSGAPGEVKNLFGFSYFTVMTPSMKSSIPPGSLILTKKTDTDKLMAGDVITYFSSDAGATVTHRIVEELHEEAAFRTQGDDNSSPDPEPVSAARVGGKDVLRV
ncbi:MAG: signal peptidase I, partial [Oscillospiraceae bacterium]|nr:signal peptidase I [Oscillospiraceae bacterium]